MKINPSLVSVLAVCSATTAHADVFQYAVTFSGANESPANASFGIGVGTVDYDSTAHTLTLQAAFSGLTGLTTASHIHGPTVNPFLLNAGVATSTPSFAGFPLAVSSGTFSSVLDLTLASSFNPNFVMANGGTLLGAETALAAAMEDGKAYWNIHSSSFTGGEIRGFLVPVPEPGTLALAGLAAAGLAVRVLGRKGRAAKP